MNYVLNINTLLYIIYIYLYKNISSYDIWYYDFYIFDMYLHVEIAACDFCILRTKMLVFISNMLHLKMRNRYRTII